MKKTHFCIIYYRRWTFFFFLKTCITVYFIILFFFFSIISMTPCFFKYLYSAYYKKRCSYTLVYILIYFLKPFYFCNINITLSMPRRENVWKHVSYQLHYYYDYYYYHDKCPAFKKHCIYYSIIIFYLKLFTFYCGKSFMVVLFYYNYTNIIIIITFNGRRSMIIQNDRS